MAFAPKRPAPVLAKKRRALSIKGDDKIVLDRVLGLTCVSNNSLAVSRSNHCIAYPAGCTIVLFYPKKNKQYHIINPSKKPISCLAIAADKYLAYGESGHSPSIRIWDISNSCSPTEVSKLNGHSFGVSCVAFSPNVRYLVSVGYQHDQNVFVWSWKSGTKVSTNKITTKISGISFSGDGRYFVTVGSRRVRYWYFDTNAKDLKNKAILPLNGRSAILGNQQNKRFVAVTCGRGIFAKYTYVVSADGLLFQFNEDREIDKMLDVQSGQGFCMCVTDTHLAVGCADGVIRLFNPVTLDYKVSLPRPHSLGVKLVPASEMLSEEKGKNPDTVAMVYDSVSCKLVVVYNDHSLYTWDLKNLSQIGKAYSCLYHNACIWDICPYSPIVSPDKLLLPVDTFITCSSDNTIRFWSLESSTCGDFCFKNIFSKELVRVIYDLEDTSCLTDTSKLPGDCSAVSDSTRGTRCVAVHPLGHQIATGDRQGNLKIFDLNFMDPVQDIMAHDAEILSISFSPHRDNETTWLATASRDRLIHLFDVPAGYTHVTTVCDHSAAITSVKFIVTADFVHIISCGADKSLMIQELRETPPSTGGSGGTGNINRVTVKRVNHIVEKSTMYDMIVDPSLKTISTVGQDRFIRVYNATTCKLKSMYKGGAGDEGSGLLKVAIDPSGLFIATSGSDKMVCIFEFSSGECIGKLYGHSEVITALKFSSCCRYFYTASGDSCIFAWKLSFELTQRMRDRLVEMGKLNPSLAVSSQERYQARKETYCISAADTAAIAKTTDPNLPTLAVAGTTATVAGTISTSTVSGTSSTSTATAPPPATVGMDDTVSGVDRQPVDVDCSDINTEATDQFDDLPDNKDGFKFSISQLPNWAQNQVYSRPSVAASIGIDVEQVNKSVTVSESDPIHVSGKWAERVDESDPILARSDSEPYSEILDENFDQTILNFDNKLLLEDLQEHVEDIEDTSPEEEEVVYPIRGRESVDPSMFKVSTPEKKSQSSSGDLNNKENIPDFEEDIVECTNSDDEDVEVEEEEEDGELETTLDETFLKANFESLSAEEAFEQQTSNISLLQLSPRRPSISTMYLKKSRSRPPGILPIPMNKTTPSPDQLLLQTTTVVSTPLVVLRDEKDSLPLSDPLCTNQILSSDDLDDQKIAEHVHDSQQQQEELTELVPTSTLSLPSPLAPPISSTCSSSPADNGPTSSDSIVSSSDGSGLQSRPRPLPSDKKNTKSKITLEEISKARKRLEELGYSSEYIHGGKGKVKEEADPASKGSVNSESFASEEAIHGEGENIIDDEQREAEKQTMEHSDVDEEVILDKFDTLATDLNSLTTTFEQMTTPSQSLLGDCSLVVKEIRMCVLRLEKFLEDKSKLSSHDSQAFESPTFPYLSSAESQRIPENCSTSETHVQNPLEHTDTSSQSVSDATEEKAQDPLQVINSVQDPTIQHKETENTLNPLETLSEPVVSDLSVRTFAGMSTSMEPLIREYSERLVEAVKLKLSSLDPTPPVNTKQ